MGEVLLNGIVAVIGLLFALWIIKVHKVGDGGVNPLDSLTNSIML